MLTQSAINTVTSFDYIAHSVPVHYVIIQTSSYCGVLLEEKKKLFHKWCFHSHLPSTFRRCATSAILSTYSYTHHTVGAFFSLTQLTASKVTHKQLQLLLYYFSSIQTTKRTIKEKSSLHHFPDTLQYYHLPLSFGSVEEEKFERLKSTLPFSHSSRGFPRAKMLLLSTLLLFCSIKSAFPTTSSNLCSTANLCCRPRDSGCVVQRVLANHSVDTSELPCYYDQACTRLDDCCRDYRDYCQGQDWKIHWFYA